MAKLSKRVAANKKLVDGLNKLSVADAVAKLKEAQTAKFDETVEVAVRLGVDPKRSDQMVRGSVLLPNGTGKQTTVLVFAKGDKEREAQEAGADFVGNDDLIEKIKGGWLEFDKAIATPDMMRDVGKIGRILGTRGLMPNPKVGTVTTEIAKAVKESKLGRVEFRVDKAANVHVVIGKLSFDSKKLEENFNAVMEQIVKLKPATSKGNYIKGVTLTSTMGPGIKVEPNKAQ